MKIEEQRYIHITMIREEAKTLKMLLEQVNHTTSNLPEWAKKGATELIEKMKPVSL